MPEEGFVPMPGADAWQTESCEAAAPAAETPAGVAAAAACTDTAPRHVQGTPDLSDTLVGFAPQVPLPYPTSPGTAACPSAGAPEQLDRLPGGALPVADSRAHGLHAHACSNGGTRRAEAAAAGAEVLPDDDSFVQRSKARPCGDGSALFTGALAAAAGASEARSAGADLAAGLGKPNGVEFAQPSGTASRGGCTPHCSPASGSLGDPSEPGERNAWAAHGRSPAHDAQQPGLSAELGKPGSPGAQSEPGGAQLLSRGQTSPAPAPRRETTGFLLQDWVGQPARAHLRFESDPESGPDPDPDSDPGPAAGVLPGVSSGAHLGLRPSDAAAAMAAVAAGGDALDMAERGADAGEPAEGEAAADAALAAIAAVAEDVAAAEADMQAGRDAPAVAAAQAVAAIAPRGTVRWPSASQRAMLEARALELNLLPPACLEVI